MSASFEKLLTAEQLADLLALSVDWIYEKAAAGELPSYKLGANRRFRASEVEDWLQRQRADQAGRSVASVHAIRG